MSRTGVIFAGIPLENPTLYHRVRFSVGDPAAWLSMDLDGEAKSVFIVRDIEMERARQSVEADQIACPADFTPAGGLSGDRATATAQALAECLRQAAVTKVVADRTLPFIFAWHVQQAGIEVDYCSELGVVERRIKDEQELAWLQEAQSTTEDAMLMACQKIAQAECDEDGNLHAGGSPLTCERLQKEISVYLLDRDFSNHHGSIVATRPDSADCHARGSGPLKTGEPVIVDIFPQSNKTRYYGDCTRTVVHGTPSDTVVKMHAAVVAAKAAATKAAVAGASADDVHSATKAAITEHGFRFARGEISDEPVMPHGTGHGIGLDVHEPILLDDNGGTLQAGEALTIEPGLYGRKFGGVRVEDVVIITDSEPRSLNKLHEGLDWS